MEALQENQSKISRHLSQLRNCGILLDRRKDQWVFYRLNPDLPEWANSIIDAAKYPLRNTLSQMKKNLHQMDCRPARH
jgi:ArsR family transcriptional regulator